MMTYQKIWAIGWSFCLFLLAAFPRARAQDIGLDGMRPIQSTFDNVPLVLHKRTTIELRITSTFATDQQIEVQLSKNDGSGILALLTDETGQHVNFATARTHLTVHPGSGVYHWPPTFAPLIHSPTINLNDILPDSNPWCLILTLDAGAADNNPNNNSSSSCFTTQRIRPLATLIVAVGPATSCNDLVEFEGAWDDVFLGAYPIPEFPIFRGVQIENGRDLSTVRCPETGGFINFSANVDQVLDDLDRLRIGTDFSVIIGVTQKPAQLPLGIAGFADLTGVRKVVWVQEDRLENFAATAMQEIAHTFRWALGAPNECLPDFPGHLCNVPASGYWVARDAPIANVIDFMNPVVTTGFQWASGETYQSLLNALSVSPVVKTPGNVTEVLKPGTVPKVIEVRAVVHDDGTADLEPWFQFEGTPDVALGDTANLSIQYLDLKGRELAHTATPFSLTRLSNGKELKHGHLSVRIPAVSGTARVRATLNGRPLFERKASLHAPVVKILGPGPTESIPPGSRVRIEWQGSDADKGDHVTYALFTQRDRNSPWIPILSRTTETRFECVAASNYRPGPVLVRVLATDSFNTAEATNLRDTTRPESSGSPKKKK